MDGTARYAGDKVGLYQKECSSMDILQEKQWKVEEEKLQVSDRN